VYAKPPFGGPTHALHYLARYTHRVAISNHRIVNVADDQVTFRWKDYAHGSASRTMTVSADEFLRRFMLHVLPKGFVRIRFFGFLANRRRARDLPRCRRALTAPSRQTGATVSVEKGTRSITWPCPRCGGTMIVIERLAARQVHALSPWASALTRRKQRPAVDAGDRSARPHTGGVLARTGAGATNHDIVRRALTCIGRRLPPRPRLWIRARWHLGWAVARSIQTP
jgi:hypothetical protein